MKPPLHGGYGKRQELRDPRDRPFLVVTQSQHDLVLRREVRQRGAHRLSRQLPAECLFRMEGQLAAVRQQEPVQFARFRRLGAPVPGGYSPGAVPRDGAEPTRELRPILQLRQRFEREEKGLLRHVPRLLLRAECLLRNHDDRAAEAPHQFVECFEVPEEGAKHQLVVIHFRIPRVSHRLFNRS